MTINPYALAELAEHDYSFLVERLEAATLVADLLELDADEIAEKLSAQYDAMRRIEDAVLLKEVEASEDFQAFIDRGPDMHPADGWS